MKVTQLRQLIREEINEVSNNPVEKLVKLLNQAKSLAEANIEKAENFDLVDLSETLENYIDELNKIGKFEVYED